MLTVTITTVEREVFNDSAVTQITLPTSEGQLTILPGHVSLMASLGMGEVVIQTKSSQKPIVLFADGGVIQVAADKVELLANMAENADEIDTAKVEEAKRKAEKLLEEKPIDVDLALIEASLQRELMRLKVKEKIT